MGVNFKIKILKTLQTTEVDTFIEIFFLHHTAYFDNKFFSMKE